MAHTKAQGSAKNNRDSAGRRLGLKVGAGQAVAAGMIVLRQRGTKYLAGAGTYLGKDQTIHADRDGTVRFEAVKKRGFDGAVRSATAAIVE